MTYRLIKLLDRLHLDACTCFYWSRRGAEEIHYDIPASAVISFICLCLFLNATSKPAFIKWTVHHFCGFLNATPTSISSVVSSRMKGWEFLFLVFFFTLSGIIGLSKMKTGCQTGRLHLELSLSPWRMLGDSGVFSGLKCCVKTSKTKGGQKI